MARRRYVDSDHHRLLEERHERSRKELFFWLERIGPEVYHGREINKYLMEQFRAAYEDEERDREIMIQAYETYTGQWWD